MRGIEFIVSSRGIEKLWGLLTETIEITEMTSEHIDNIVELAATLASRAGEIEKVLVIYTVAGDESDKEQQRSLDNGLKLETVNWMVDGFKMWLLMGAMGCGKQEERD